MTLLLMEGRSQHQHFVWTSRQFIAGHVNTNGQFRAELWEVRTQADMWKNMQKSPWPCENLNLTPQLQ